VVSSRPEDTPQFACAGAGLREQGIGFSAQGRPASAKPGRDVATGAEQSAGGGANRGAPHGNRRKSETGSTDCYWGNPGMVAAASPRACAQSASDGATADHAHGCLSVEASRPGSLATAAREPWAAGAQTTGAVSRYTSNGRTAILGGDACLRLHPCCDLPVHETAEHVRQDRAGRWSLWSYYGHHCGRDGTERVDPRTANVESWSRDLTLEVDGALTVSTAPGSGI
jgi:hypothetical protein